MLFLDWCRLFIGSKLFLALLHIDVQAAFFVASNDLVKEIIACVHELSSDEKASQQRLWLVEFCCCHEKHPALMLHTSQLFSSSEDSSLSQHESIPFSVPVALSFVENFRANVDLIALHRIHLDSENEVRLRGQNFHF